VRSWNALFAPRNTPQPVLARLTRALQHAVADPALRRQMEGLGVQLPAPQDTTPATVASLIAKGLRDDVPALRAKGDYLD
jgi:tripartite-type tricarboxylate transporter receptor subunit TctC